MRYRELLEAPISSYELLGPETGDGQTRHMFHTGTTFDDRDQKLLQSEKGKAKIIRAFANTRHNFRVVFLNDTIFDSGSARANNLVTDYINTTKSGIHDSFGKIKGQPGIITVVAIGNLSATDKMPMTAWTLAHKIGHSFQDYTSASTQWADQVPTPLLHKITAVGEAIHRIDQIDRIGEYRAKPKNAIKAIDGPLALKDKLTMKSARTGMIDTFEMFPEIIAQYLLTGRVKMNLENEVAIRALADLNREIDELFDMIIGKVIVEV